jgi:hypothetical protein
MRLTPSQIMYLYPNLLQKLIPENLNTPHSTKWTSSPKQCRTWRGKVHVSHDRVTRSAKCPVARTNRNLSENDAPHSQRGKYRTRVTELPVGRTMSTHVSTATFNVIQPHYFNLRNSSPEMKRHDRKTLTAALQRNFTVSFNDTFPSAAATFCGGRFRRPT